MEVTVTVAPEPATEVGTEILKFDAVGGEVNVTVPYVAVPIEFVTDTVPVVPEPTTTTSAVPFVEVMELTAVPPIVTLAADAGYKYVPFIVKLETLAHTLEVLKLVMVGAPQ